MVRRVLQSHTILLVQPGRKPEGRTYSDYESVNECLEGALPLACSRRIAGRAYENGAAIRDLGRTETDAAIRIGYCILVRRNYFVYNHYFKQNNNNYGKPKCNINILF